MGGKWGKFSCSQCSLSNDTGFFQQWEVNKFYFLAFLYTLFISRNVPHQSCDLLQVLIMHQENPISTNIEENHVSQSTSCALLSETL